MGAASIIEITNINFFITNSLCEEDVEIKKVFKLFLIKLRNPSS
tara:strand:- start:1340 stop:1471 length:132 start_codon:yes stop_codon:yes gene_type:complete